MSEVTDTALKAYFQNGSRPTEANYTDLIDSKVNKPELASTDAGKGADLVANVQKIYNVKDYGATGDGSTDDLAALQSAQDAAAAVKGAVYFPAGTYGVSGPLLVDSYVTLVGVGRGSTFIKAIDSATFTAAQGVVMTRGFTEDADLWDYYSPYPAGLTMGVRVRDLSIDGNRANVANANGLMIYGGQWQIENLGVMSTAGHGVWTEAGSTGSSTSGDDRHDFLNMHESTANNVFIVNADKHGWLYRGPNDSYIDNIQIKTCGYAGFYQDNDTTIAVGGLKIGTLHAYSCVGGHADEYMIRLYSAIADRIYTDSPGKGGLHITGSFSRVGHVVSLWNTATGPGAYWSVLADVATSIGDIRDVQTTAMTSGSFGGTLYLASGSDKSVIGSVKAAAHSSSSIAMTGVRVGSSFNTISRGSLNTYDMTGGKGLWLETSGNTVGLNINDCTTAVDYDNSGIGRNHLRLGVYNCTTDVDNAADISRSDLITIVTDQTDPNLSIAEAGATRVYAEELKRFDVAYAASITPDAEGYSYYKVAALTGNITVNEPSGTPPDGKLLAFQFQQDGTGGRTITWNAAFKTNYADTGNVLNTRYTIRFMWDGSFWVQQGAGSGWF